MNIDSENREHYHVSNHFSDVYAECCVKHEFRSCSLPMRSCLQTDNIFNKSYLKLVTCDHQF